MKRIAYTALFVWCIVVPVFSWAGFDEGLEAHNKMDYATALKEWQPLPDQDNTGVQNSMGVAYEQGFGVAHDDAMAVKWYAKAAKQDDADAQHWLEQANTANGDSIENNSLETVNNETNFLEQLAGEAGELPNADQVNTTSTPSASKAGKIFHDCAGCPEMGDIHAESFDMGSPDTESRRDDNEGHVHRANIASFALGKTEITRGQFATFVIKPKYKIGDKCWTLDGGKFAERDGSWNKLGYTQDDQHPAACINWNNAKAYAKWMSRKTGKRYRLPTASEWEYASSRDTGTARYWVSSRNEVCAYANVADKTAQAQIDGATSWLVHNCTDGFAYTAPVGSFKANSFGLYEMPENVWEWTGGSYRDNYKDAPTDGGAWQLSGAKRLLRGGSWNRSPEDVRSAIRNMNKPELRFSNFGFRLARALP